MKVIHQKEDLGKIMKILKVSFRELEARYMNLKGRRKIL